MPDCIPSTRNPAKKVAVSRVVDDVTPANPIEPTTGTASTNIKVMPRKRCRCSHQHSASAPIVPPTCSTAPASATVVGGSLAAVSKVGVQLSRKKYPIRLSANSNHRSGVISAKPWRNK